MKTIQNVLDNWKFKAIDCRDKGRFIQFLNLEEAQKFCEFEKEVTTGNWEKKEWTRENILKQLKKDVIFASDKASDHRGLSASAMYRCIRLWNWVLEEGLENFKEYGSYGFALINKTAEKYGWENDVFDESSSDSQ